METLTLSILCIAAIMVIADRAATWLGFWINSKELEGKHHKDDDAGVVHDWYTEVFSYNQSKKSKGAT